MLENARLVHETRQRNAELALINSVQEALAGELEMQAIYDVVGDKIQEIFDAQVVDIGLFDFAAGLIRYPYTIERGVRFPDEPTPIERSPSVQQIIETKAPVLVNDVPARDREQGYPSPVMQGEPALSVLFAPMVSGEEVRGRISLQNLDRTNAFDENDVRLLTTLAGSLSVALENARLVHETRQRNAELALINSVQEAIAGELDPQAIYDAVGDQIREIFDAQVVSIATLEDAKGLLHDMYVIERGERLQTSPYSPTGISQYVLETHESLLINENLDAEMERRGSYVPVGESPKSVLFVPLVAGGRASGLISLQNIDREHAFGPSDQQLLETLAGSLSVALENARLVHETRQRNAELALISGVQEAIAGELDQQAIYDAVGDRIQEIFDAQTVMILMLEESTGHVVVPYSIERGERQQWEPMAPSGFTGHVLERRESLLINEDVAGEGDRIGGRRARHRRGAEVGSVRPARYRRQGDRRDLASERRPGARLQRVRPAAFGDLGREPERGARERAAGARDAAAERRAGGDQQRPGRHRRRARRPGDLRGRRRQDPGDLRRAGRADQYAGRGDGAHAFPVRPRAR